MAEPLKNMFTLATVAEIGRTLPVDSTQFTRDCEPGFDGLGLMDRARHVATVMQRHLDPDPATAIEQLNEAIGTEPRGFFYNPHSFFIQEYGLPAYDESIAAMHRLTQVFTAEFCIRPFIVEHPRTMDQLREWTADPSEHVRRLVSEGTRPRLPWATQLPHFRKDPEPVIALLDLLKDDPSEYVRRSVGNNLNDISKDHPRRAIEVATAWMPRPLVRRGLRTLIKAGDPDALAVLGYVAGAATARADLPDTLQIGQRLRLAVEVDSQTPVMVDIVVEFVRPRGVGRKVFKGAELPGSGTVRRTISFEQLSTRKVYPGPHRIAVLLNGAQVDLGLIVIRHD
jgi:3-methyladenine DNA glycosylase AlkC